MKQCFYEVLGLAPDCTEDEVKQSYRRMALVWHPDKNRDNPDATAKFQQLQEAYATLSDPQERAWYDGHKKQILRGDTDISSGGDDPSGLDLFKFFSRECYQGMHDAPGGFYQTYEALFSNIIEAENKFGCIKESRTGQPFGNSRSAPTVVSRFYNWWSTFTTFRSMSHAEVWNLKEADNRHVRRAMDKENQEARNRARKEYNDTVRELVYFLKKRDPRMKEVVLHQARERQKKADEAEERRRAAAEKKRADREARQAQAAAVLAELEREKDEARARGQYFYSSESESAEVVQVFRCDLCRKTFKSENQLLNHTKTKKHQQALRQAAAQIEPASESCDDGSEKSEPIDTEPLTIGVDEAQPQAFDTSDAESVQSSEFQQLLSTSHAVKAVDEDAASYESSSKDFDSDDSVDPFVAAYLRKQN